MNKSESKYYNTSLYMNQALIEILSKKDYEFITIKELCKKAGVNRSTFYLHYDSIDDLLKETIDNIDKNFISYFSNKDMVFIEKLKNKDKKQLILITPEYLIPYLNYIKENRIIYQVSAKKPELMNSTQKFAFLQENILLPIYKKFGIEEAKGKYLSAYYIKGIYSVINEWIKEGCVDDVKFLCEIIIDCVRPYENKDET